MVGRNLSLTACGLLLIFAPLSRADEPENPSPRLTPSALELRGWVQQLNADDYDAREDAARKLTEAGPASIEALVEGLASDQAEVAWRCGAALEQIGVEGDEKTIDLIVKHLDAAQAKSGKKGINSLARDLYARQKQFRRDRAVAQIRKHGGQIAGIGIEGGLEEMAIAPMIGPVMIFDGPAIALAEPLPAPVAEPAEVEAPAAMGIFGEFARAIARVLAPDVVRVEREFADLPAIPVPDAPALPLPPVVEERAPVEKPAEEKRPEAKPAEDTALPAVEGSEPAPVAEIEAAEVAVAEVAIAGGMAAMDIGSDLPVESGWAQLALDQNWRGGDEGLAVLADMPELSQIEIRGARLTDKALDHFANLPRLGMLNIHASPFSRDELLKFHRRRPNTMVYARGEAMLGVNADFNSSPLLLASVYDGSGASDAGLQVGDIIHQLDGVKIRDFSELTICIAAKKPGEQIEVVYERGGKKHTVQVELKKRTVDN
ncbi:MAG TPA: PDZ domain-containing protein [Pirellulaceae bacterium]|nr:PDZ domain-containing protein [Pirellulaceae bacterium]